MLPFNQELMKSAKLSLQSLATCFNRKHSSWLPDTLPTSNFVRQPPNVLTPKVWVHKRTIIHSGSVVVNYTQFE